LLQSVPRPPLRDGGEIGLRELGEHGPSAADDKQGQEVRSRDHAEAIARAGQPLRYWTIRRKTTLGCAFGAFCFVAYTGCFGPLARRDNLWETLSLLCAASLVLVPFGAFIGLLLGPFVEALVRAFVRQADEAFSITKYGRPVGVLPASPGLVLSVTINHPLGSVCHGKSGSRTQRLVPASRGFSSGHPWSIGADEAKRVPA
jgi:hypothetical protein